MNYLDILKVEKTDDEVQMIDLSVPDNHNFILSNGVLSHNSGKSYLMRSIIDRLYASSQYFETKEWMSSGEKINICILTDVKNEFGSSIESNEDVKYCSLGERPTSLPVKSFKPVFLGRDKSCEPIQMSLQQLTFFDFLTLFDLMDGSSAQKTIMQVFHMQIENGYIKTLEDLRMVLEDTQMSPATKNYLESKIDILEKSGVIGDEYNVDFSEEMEKGYIPILNLEGFEKLGRTASGFPQAYVAIILRRIIQMKRIGRPKGKMWIFIDEIRRFCDKSKNSVSKTEILECIDVTAGYGINMVMAAQEIKGIPDELINQSKYLFVPFNVDRPIFQEILSRKGMYVYTRPEDSEDLNFELQSMRKRIGSGNRQWMCIRSDTRDFIRFFPYSTLSKHKEEK